MMNETILHAKKIVSRTNGGWIYEIDLLFDGSEFSLTEGLPIHIDGRDAASLIPGLDEDAAEIGDRFTDVVDIENRMQFEHVFGDVLTQDAEELLNDVYSARAWKLFMLDMSGRRTECVSLLTDCFTDAVVKELPGHAPCWISLSYADSGFEDWDVQLNDWNEVYSNMHDGFAPLNASQVMSIIEEFAPSSRFLDRTEFRSQVTKQGNSLVLKITDQCRRLGIGVGDEVDVVMSRSSPEDNTRLRAFSAKRWTPIEDPDDLCHRDGCDLDKVRGFLDEFDIIGTVSPGNFMMEEMRTYGPHVMMTMDHLNFFKMRSGENMVVAQPYIKNMDMNFAEAWARRNGCVVDEYREKSWHHPPETTLLVFKRMENPTWQLPSDSTKV